MPGVARTVEALLDALDHRTVDVLGVSLGGVIAQQLAHQAPQRVRRLVLAATLSLTNQLIEGSESGDFKDLCGDLYRDYSWGRDVYEVGSNGLFRVDFYVINDKRAGAEPAKMSVMLYRPQSPPGSATRPR